MTLRSKIKNYFALKTLLSDGDPGIFKNKIACTLRGKIFEIGIKN
jgi:hypothetical protein